MKRKTLNRSNRKMRESKKMKGTLGRHLQVQLGQRQISLIPLQFQHQSCSSNPSSLFRNLLDSEPTDKQFHSSPGNTNVAAGIDDKDFILSQDFFCTPDYITPVDQNLLNSFDCNKENILCPESPEKLNTIRTKKLRWGVNPLSPPGSFHQNDFEEIEKETSSIEEMEVGKTALAVNEAEKCQNYVSQSAVALRCRVMPPPCIKNPYLMDASEVDVDPFGSRRSKCAGFFSSNIGGDGLSRYHTDFQEIQQIGSGNFSRVFKVLKRIDGCFYAVKQSTRKLHQDADRRKALMEVQALAALGCHENIVGYYSSWFESEQLYIQMELCDCSLSTRKSSKGFTEGEVLEVLYQIAKALQFIHERGIAHLDVKPDNIYVKNGVHKLGDFGCATLLNQSLPIEEGDARYMPQEILNEIYDHLDSTKLTSFLWELLFMNSLEGRLFHNQDLNFLISGRENCHFFLAIPCNFRTC